MARLMAMGLAALVWLGAGASGQEAKVIFDGKTPNGWIINGTGKPVPAKNVQEDGLNPHESGAYVVLHEQPVKDFVLEFDYKLSKGCNSGVFLRVADPKDPVMTGLEVALDDTTGTGFHDTGAIYDLVKPTANAQKPAGEWNHMVITAKGPSITIELNGKKVSEFDHDAFPEAGKRPDGSKHKFGDVVIKDLNRKGFFGFQDHGSNVWFKNIKLTNLDDTKAR